jgi:hypothetical protein
MDPGEDKMHRPYWDYMTVAVWLVTRGTNEIKNHQLAVAAAATGGVHYRALRDRTVRTALDQIGSELHAQYIIGYRPNSQPWPGLSHDHREGFEAR